MERTWFLQRFDGFLRKAEKEIYGKYAEEGFFPIKKEEGVSQPYDTPSMLFMSMETKLSSSTNEVYLLFLTLLCFLFLTVPNLHYFSSDGNDIQYRNDEEKY